ncbi:MAG: class I SAM-dependent methyltransferase [Actinomycetes bacterium]
MSDGSRHQGLKTVDRGDGSLWETVGRLQLDFLVGHGLRPHHRLLDVGCGTLRGGVRVAEYLEPGHYHGIEVNPSLLDTGYQRELTPHARERLPRENLRATDRFDCDFGVPFDYAIAPSLFSHIPLNHIRLCLYRVAHVMAPGGRFFATFSEAPKDFPLDDVQPGARGAWTERNPFFYYRGDLAWAASFSPWKASYVGDWGHPRGLKMVEFRRTAGRNGSPGPGRARSLAGLIPHARSGRRSR